MHKKPDSFYRYFDYEGAFETINSQNIRWIHPSKLNDPFDCAIDTCKPPDFKSLNIEECVAALCANSKYQYVAEVYKSPDGKEKLSRYFERVFTDFRIKAPELQTILQNIINENYIICLTTELSNLLMWSHYARNHTGAVIEFAAVNDNIFCAAEPINYRNEIPRLFGNEKDCIMFALKGNTPENRKYIFDLCALTKSIYWNYENEWRIICPLPEANGSQYYNMKLNTYDVRAVYLGCNMNLENQNKYVEVIRNNFPEAHVYKANKNATRFSLDFLNI